MTDLKEVYNCSINQNTEKDPMAKANFVFHGLFPDVRQSDRAYKEIAKVLFDIDFNGRFYSHLIADIEYLDASNELEV